MAALTFTAVAAPPTFGAPGPAYGPGTSRTGRTKCRALAPQQSYSRSQYRAAPECQVSQTRRHLPAPTASPLPRNDCRTDESDALPRAKSGVSTATGMGCTCRSGCSWPKGACVGRTVQNRFSASHADLRGFAAFNWECVLCRPKTSQSTQVSILQTEVIMKSLSTSLHKLANRAGGAFGIR